MSNETRRSFVRKAGFGAATLGLMGAASFKGANEKVVVALIGCGSRGSGVAQAMGGAAFVCDPDQSRLASVAKRLKAPASNAVTDMRRIFDNKSVDAVIIATPDHWHAPAAIMALEAGKHVYVEKPWSHNFRESQLLVEAARRSKRVVQHGTQSRSKGIVADGIQLLREGVIGKILVAKALNIQRRGNIGHEKPSDPPPGVDYDTWVGPAEFVPYQKNRFHYSWHWWHNFGTGDIGNDGVHELDYARWGLGVETLPTKIAGVGGKLYFDDDQEFPDTMTVTFEYAGDGAVGATRHLIFEMRIWQPCFANDIDNGCEFYGTDGRMILSKRGVVEIFDKNNKKIEAKAKNPPQLLEHQEDFIDAIKTGRKPNADIETAHRSVALAHLGNIACRLNRSLTFDPKAEKIVSDDEANRLLSRTYRKGGYWAIPRGV